MHSVIRPLTKKIRGISLRQAEGRSQSYDTAHHCNLP